MSLFARPLADGARLDLEGLSLRLKVNPRARRVSLRIDARSGEAVATAPSARRLPDAVAFARTRRGWLAERLASRAATPAPAAGEATGGVRGPLHVLVPDGRRPRLAGDANHRLRAPARSILQLVVRAVRRSALEVFQARTAGALRAPGRPRRRR